MMYLLPLLRLPPALLLLSVGIPPPFAEGIQCWKGIAGNLLDPERAEHEIRAVVCPEGGNKQQKCFSFTCRSADHRSATLLGCLSEFGTNQRQQEWCAGLGGEQHSRNQCAQDLCNERGPGSFDSTPGFLLASLASIVVCAILFRARHRNQKAECSTNPLPEAIH